MIYDNSALVYLPKNIGKRAPGISPFGGVWGTSTLPVHISIDKYNYFAMYRALIILLGLFSVAKAQQSFKNVAIIGGGVGAASAALHLRELVQGDLDIDL